MSATRRRLAVSPGVLIRVKPLGRGALRPYIIFIIACNVPRIGGGLSGPSTMSNSYFMSVSFLLDEDNPFMGSIIESALRVLGAHSIKKTFDDCGAPQIMKVSMPDIILVDWEMQLIDELQFVKLVRRSKDSPNPYVSIIMLSGHSEYNRVMEARDVGIN
jgi:PleD family two-component response regulator